MSLISGLLGGAARKKSKNKKQWLAGPPLGVLFREVQNPSGFAKLLRLGGFSKRALIHANGPKVLFATSMSGYNHGMVMDALLSNAVWARGANPHFFVCDQALAGCQKIKYKESVSSGITTAIAPGECAKCTGAGDTLLDGSPFPVWRLSEFIDADVESECKALAESLPIEKIKPYTIDGIAIGEHATAGALRFFARGDLAAEPNGELVVRKYFYSALILKAAFEKLLDREKFDVVVAHHGIYVPQGIINEVCRFKKVRFIAWNPAYKQGCFIFSHGDTYHKTMVSEPTGDWQQASWSEDKRAELLDYLNSRRTGDRDWIKFHQDPVARFDEIRDQLKLDPAKPVVTLLSNVVWDAQLHYPSNAFPGMTPWIFATIDHFVYRSDVQLVIRVHPAELTGFVKSRQLLVDEIAKRYPSLPDHIKIVGPENAISTYGLCDISDTVLIYNTKTGMEIAAIGSRVAVAGEAWIRNKGFSVDIETPAEYESFLRALPLRAKMDDSKLELAQKYAYHVFFRRMIPLEFMGLENRVQFTLDIKGLESLAPGRSKGLDVICNGIVKGTPFIIDQ